jgi:hypothetical protein
MPESARAMLLPGPILIIKLSDHGFIRAPGAIITTSWCAKPQGRA